MKKCKRNFLCIMVCCLMLFSAAGQTYPDIRSIFINKCAICHYPTGNAPFSLLTYDDVKKRITLIKKVIQSKYMPPWQPDTHYRAFANDRSLTQNELSDLVAWIDKNAPKKYWNTSKEIPDNISLNKFYNRTPDVIFKTDTPYLVKGENAEKFIQFKVPFNLSDTANIEGIEFYSNNKKIIHHVNYGFYAAPDTSINIYSGGSVVDTHENSPQAQFFNSLQKEMIYYTGWIPGSTYEYYPPDGFGWTLPKRGVVIFTVHYFAIAADEKSIVGVKLYFRKNPIQRQIRVISLGSGGIGERDIYPALFISPNKINTFKLIVRTPEDQSIMYVWPHMHFLGKEFYAYAVTPANDTINLIHIPQWDYKRQDMYRMKTLVKIPANSVITLIGTYDNTTNNPFNPNSPPKLVFSTGDMTSTDEMFTLLMIYVPYEKGDENISLE